MNRHSNPDSILQGNFCDILNFFRGKECDEADRLAQRALSIVLSTNHLVQTGDEVDTDPFCANMFAGSALGSISESIKHYPFVRQPSWRAADAPVDLSDDDYNDILDAAENMIEMAEGLMPPRLDPADIAAERFFAIGSHGGTDLPAALDRVAELIASDLPADGYNRYVIVIGDDDPLLEFDIEVWKGTVEPEAADMREARARAAYGWSQLRSLTDGFKHDPDEFAELIGALDASQRKTSTAG